MKFLDNILNKIDAIALLRIALGIVFLWFGALKIFGLSPVSYLIESTFLFMGENFILILGIVEVLIGLGFLFKKFVRFIFIIFFFQMLGTFSSVIFNPDMFFANWNIFAPTLEGEFLIKNLVLIAAGIAVAKYSKE